MNSNFLVVIVLAPESVDAGWKQWEQVPRAAASFQSNLKNFIFWIVRYSVFDVMIPCGLAYSNKVSVFADFPTIKAPSIIAIS